MQRWLLVGLVVFTSCVRRASTPSSTVEFDPMVITGDLELEKLNAEELFAAGTSYYAAEDYVQAARHFVRLVDFFPQAKNRNTALYNAGLSLEKLKMWDDALMRFSELANPATGTGDALDASFRMAETLYHLERFEDAVRVLNTLASRSDLHLDKVIEARTQQGICELEAGNKDAAEATLRKAVALYTDAQKRESMDDYFPAQAQFFLGEVFRLHYESVTLDANKTVDALAKDVEFKSELLLSAQGHYLRAIRIGNGYWATASGAQIGSLYENFYHHMMNAEAPRELNPGEADVYKQELRKKIRVLLTKAINIYERTIETAERIGTRSPFVDKTRESLRRMKELLLADAEQDEEKKTVPSATPPAGNKSKVPHSSRSTGRSDWPLARAARP
jgi:TolA-binding protein